MTEYDCRPVYYIRITARYYFIIAIEFLYLLK